MASFFTEKFDINYYSPEALILAQNAPTPFDGRALPGPAGELTALPIPPSWIKGTGPLGRGKEMGGEKEKGGLEPNIYYRFGVTEATVLSHQRVVGL